MKTENIALQRAALMGLITAILDDQGEKTLVQIKDRIVDTVSFLIEIEAMVGDGIDHVATTSARRHMEQEIALSQVKDLLK